MHEAAFFDLDKTVIARASVVAFGRPFYHEGLIPRRTILRALYGQLLYLYLGADEAKIARMRASMLELTKGWEHARVSRIVEEALRGIVDPIIYSEALDLMARHRSEGRVIVIVSASPTEIVEPLARYLGADRAIASKARLDADGRYTGEMDFDAFGPSKVNAMRSLAAEMGVDLSACWAYSDSATDLPMLEAVGHPVAVNPDRELLRTAQEREWEIRHFSRPVRLRDRVPVPRASTAAAAGAALVAITGGVVWWRVRGRGTLGQPIRRIALVQSTRSLRTATTPTAIRMARKRSFFMPGRLLPPWMAGIQTSGNTRTPRVATH